MLKSRVLHPSIRTPHLLFHNHSIDATTLLTHDFDDNASAIRTVSKQQPAAQRRVGIQYQAKPLSTIADKRCARIPYVGERPASDLSESSFLMPIVPLI